MKGRVGPRAKLRCPLLRPWTFAQELVLGRSGQIEVNLDSGAWVLGLASWWLVPFSMVVGTGEWPSGRGYDWHPGNLTGPP